MSGSLRGVNLGGWLVLEPWMTPSLFDGTAAVDEFTFMDTPGARQRLRQHHESFITAEDFAWIADRGLDLVRLPVGHWVLASDPPYLAAPDILDWAMDTAAAYGLRVLVDLHGVSGSQNGRDHSGRAGPRQWYREQAHRDHTYGALTDLARRYRDHPALWGIELVNEPTDWRVWRLWHFHRTAYVQLQQVLAPGTHIVFSDGYLPLLFRGTIRGPETHPVVMDCHLYQCFYPWDTRKSLSGHVRKAVRRGRLVRWLSRAHPVLVGEWSAALDGRAYQGSDSTDRSSLTAHYVEAQLAGYREALGWCFWSYKSEHADDWNFRHLVESGLIRL